MIDAKIKVGLLILVTILAGMLVVVNLGDIQLKKGYEFYVMFDDLADLPTRPIIKISGVEVGRVVKIDLHNQRARVKVWIDEDIRIHKDTKAKILKMGMIGNTYIGMTFGSDSSPFIQPGDTIEGKSPISYEALVESLVTGLDKVVSVFQDLGSSGDSINEVLINLKTISRDIDNAFGANGNNLAMAISNISEAAASVNNVVINESAEVSESIKKIGLAAEDLRSLVAYVRSGRGAAGKLLTSEEYGEKIGETIDSIYSASTDLKQAVNRFKGFDTAVDSSVYYEPSSEEFRTYAGLSFRTSSERYLNLSLENIKSPGQTSGYFDSDGDRVNALTVTAGKKFGMFNLYGGSIRSSGGIGASLDLYKVWNIETEIFDFGNEKPWLRLGSKLTLYDFLKIGLYYENMLDDGSLRTGLQLELD